MFFSGIVQLLHIGIVFHAVFLWSIFDIYFVSPVVPIHQHFSPASTAEAPAKRVVVISADGLRADKLFQLYPDPPFESVPPLPDVRDFTWVDGPDHPEQYTPEGFTTPAPYLRSLILDKQAAWGVSHTRVPTESRPGHVALLAGMYEDVSAVLKGWQVNPVDFDSTLNQSAHAWAFGSPDIVPMFHLGASPPSKVTMDCYEGHDEDFSRDAVDLDLWVLERLRNLLNDAATDTAVEEQLAQQGNMIFLHLLGLDTTGHSYRPHSPEYYRNIVIVDRIVQTVVAMLDQFYKKIDGDTTQTAFILTADHGMSSIGNHGDGHPDNTRTPIMAWGAGFQAAPGEVEDCLPADSHDEYSASWGLSKSFRQDMEQASVAALITAVTGNPFPGHSVGALPLSYLNAPKRYKAEAVLANARGIMEQYFVNQDIREARTLFFKPFQEASPRSMMESYTKAEALLQEPDISLKEIQKEAESLISLSLRGLRYLHAYDWLLLRVVVVCGYLSWIATTASFILRHYVFQHSKQLSLPPRGYTWCTLSIWALATVLFAKFAQEQAPASYYLYTAGSAYLLALAVSDLQPLLLLLKLAGSQPMSSAMVGAALLLGLECMVFGYFERQSWTMGLAFCGLSGWYWCPSKPKATLWTFVCLATGAFTLLPVEKGESLWCLAASGLLFIMAAYSYQQMGESMHISAIIWVQMLTMTASTVVALRSAQSLQAKEGLPLINQWAAWLILLCSLVQPLYLVKMVRDHTDRLVLLAFNFVPIFIILSISYETLFFFSYSALLLAWVSCEYMITAPEQAAEPVGTDQTRGGQTGNEARSSSGTTKSLELADLRRACFLLGFVHVAFFGTGNVASVSSFYLEPVYRLVPVFDPFLMGSLLLFKIMIPFLILASAVTVITRQLKLPTFAIFLLALCISDVLTLNFFFMVRDEGSWLDIGQSISHFAISNLLLVFCGMLNLIGAWLMQ